MGDAIKVLSNPNECATIGQAQLTSNLQQLERDTIAFLHSIWRAQGVTNKKIVTVKR